MALHDQSELAVIRTSERSADPIDYRRVRRAIEGKVVTRIARGSYAPTDAWRRMTPREQHQQRVHEATTRVCGEMLLSHFAAAAIHGIDILGAWPQTVDVRTDRSAGGRSTGLIRRRSMGVDDAQIERWNGHHVTTPAQTAMDLAAVVPFTQGVVVLDQTLWRRRAGGPLATREDLYDALENGSIRRGGVKARRALEFATELSDSVRESHSRVLIARLGFPAPVLQHPIRLLDGSTIYPDFFWTPWDHAGEFDGVGKYFDPVLLDGRTPEEALLAEKDRGDALRRAVTRVSRWRTPALQMPRQLYDILIADGLPSTRPRPSASFRGW